jgi:hypothetical protein
MWYVENINGNGSKVRSYFSSYQEAWNYSQWTLGKIGYNPEELKRWIRR